LEEKKMKKLLLVLALVASALLTASVCAQDDLFTLVRDEPIVEQGSANEWDVPYTDPGAVFFHDGLFHMFRNGFKGWPASVQIGYLTSEDGVNWTEVSEDPVMRTLDVPYAGIAALASDVMVLEDGTWVLYFYTWETRDGSLSPGAIGRATAPAPTGPWTADAETILNPGSEGSWDELRLSAPRVVQMEDGYRMYYTGYDASGIGSGRIGMATSSDGITWTKYDDPETSEFLYTESDPVLMPPEGVHDVNQPMVEITPDGWVMVFRQVDFSGTPPQMSLNYALSDDGIDWQIASETPFWGRTTVPNSMGFWYTAMEYQDYTYYLYVEAGVGRGTNIYVATHEGALTS
jgi:predicted GH43/DUF377 family glycosyl hydrolase